MITRSSIAFEDFLGSSIAPQVMPPWNIVKDDKQCVHFTNFFQKYNEYNSIINTQFNSLFYEKI